MASIEKRESKNNKISYYIRTNFVDSNTGKTVRKTKTWVAPAGVSESEAKKRVADVAIDFEREIKENMFIGIDDSDYTVEQYSKIYIEYLKKNFFYSHYYHNYYCFQKYY